MQGLNAFWLQFSNDLIVLSYNLSYNDVKMQIDMIINWEVVYET